MCKSRENVAKRLIFQNCTTLTTCTTQKIGNRLRIYEGKNQNGMISKPERNLTRIEIDGKRVAKYREESKKIGDTSLKIINFVKS